MYNLLGHGVEVDCRNAYGHTPLKSASRTQDDETFLQPLLSAGADIDPRDYEGETALMCAARNEKVEITAYLLASGAGMTAHTIWGLTALDLCVRYNCHQMLLFLL
jgi:ankyrin repeat protein